MVNLTPTVDRVSRFANSILHVKDQIKLKQAVNFAWPTIGLKSDWGER